VQLSEKTLADWTAYVLAEYPKEACAYVVDGNLYPVTNLSETPEQTFKVDAVERIKAHAVGNVEAFLHSHPYKLENSNPQWNHEWATKADMITWNSDNLPWGIVATDGEGLTQVVWYDDSMEAIAPLVGREFISGKHDCYSVIRDHYRLNLGIPLVNYSRGMGWWDEGDNLYEENYTKAGFVEVSIDDIQIKDVLLMKLNTVVPSHAAVVTSTNEILHHCIGRLSGYDSLSKWHRQIVKALRYKGVPVDAT
jgi:cell wall-associated NlpC family hydrolase